MGAQITEARQATLMPEFLGRLTQMPIDHGVLEVHDVEFDPDAFFEGLADTPYTVIPTTEGLLSVVKERPQTAGPLDNSGRTLSVGFHTDGLGVTPRPEILLLVCKTPGTVEGITTEFADSRRFLPLLSPAEQERARHSQISFETRGGETLVYPLVNINPRSGDETVILGVGERVNIFAEEGYRQSHDADVALRAHLMDVAQQSVVRRHDWVGAAVGQTVVSENLTYPHQRVNKANLADPNRELYRVWLARVPGR